MKTVKMLGTEIGSETRGDVREAFAQVSWFIRRGHNVCGDSAFVHMDDSKVVAAVLDGVSGEPGADQASSVAAVALVNHLKNIASPDKNDIQNAFVKAHSNIVFGLTTVALAVIMKDGRFLCGSVGDSMAYSVETRGTARPELPGARIVGPGSPLLRYLTYRNVVPAALGMQKDMEMCFKRGELSKGESVLLMTDGVTDNLTIYVENGVVKDCTGAKDLGSIIGDAKDAASVVRRIGDEIIRRMDAKFDIRDPGRVLVAKKDDVAVICVRYTGNGIVGEGIRQASKIRRASKKKRKDL
jgi:serine/threonine protein phosphatase PrpC